MQNTQKKLYLAIFAFCFTLLAILLIFFQVYEARLSNVRAEYVENSRELIRAERRANLKNELQKELASVGDDVALVDTALLEKENILNFIENLENIASVSTTSYEVRVAQEIKNEQTGELEAINFNINLQSSFNGLMTFLQGIKRMSYLMNETQASIGYSPDGETLITNLIIKVYIK